MIEDTTDDRLLEVLEEALGARIIEEMPRTVGRYQFTHALTQETLSAELSTTRRVRLHARIAEALEQLYGAQSDAHAAELALHFAEAQTVLGAEKLVRYSILAGEKALDSYAFEEALGHFQRAVAAKEGQPPDAETAALFYGLGRAQIATRSRFDYEESQHNLRLAFDYFVEAGDVDAAVAVAEFPIPVLRGIDTGRTEFISRALSLVPTDSIHAGVLLAAYGSTLYHETGDYAGAQEAFGRALAIAERDHDQYLEMRTLAHATDVDFWNLRWDELPAKGRRAIDLARRLDDLRIEVAALFQISSTLAAKGEREEAQRLAESMLAPAERLRDVPSLTDALWLNGTLCRAEGKWQDARAFQERYQTIWTRGPRALSDLMVLDFQLGDFAQGESRLELIVENPGTGFV